MLRASVEGTPCQCMWHRRRTCTLLQLRDPVLPSVRLPLAPALVSVAPHLAPHRAEFARDRHRSQPEPLTVLSIWISLAYGTQIGPQPPLLCHLGQQINLTGPVWSDWAFPMERYCAKLKPAAKSRRHPWPAMDGFVYNSAVVDQVANRYNLTAEDLRLLPTPNERVQFSDPACEF